MRSATGPRAEAGCAPGPAPRRDPPTPPRHRPPRRHGESDSASLSPPSHRTRVVQGEATVSIRSNAAVTARGGDAPLRDGTVTLSACCPCYRGKDRIGAKGVGEIGEQSPPRPDRCPWAATSETVVPHRGRERQAHVPSQHAQAFDGHLDELALILDGVPQLV